MSSTSDDLRDRVAVLLRDAEERAWENLARGKYSGFGYWAAKAVQFRELLDISHHPSPFRPLRDLAKGHISQSLVVPSEEGERRGV